MELRWRQPCSNPVAPCNYNAKLIKHETQPLTKQGSFTSVQMVHTHTHVFHSTLSVTVLQSPACTMGHKSSWWATHVCCSQLTEAFRFTFFRWLLSPLWSFQNCNLSTFLCLSLLANKGHRNSPVHVMLVPNLPVPGLFPPRFAVQRRQCADTHVYVYIYVCVCAYVSI